MCIINTKKLLYDKRGQSIVEAALIAPLLIFLLFSTIIFGMVINARIVISSAAREGARHMALFNNQSAARERVAESMAILPHKFNETVLFNPQTDVVISDIGPNIEVTVNYRHPSMVPLLPAIISPGVPAWETNMPLRGVAVHRKEYD